MPKISHKGLKVYILWSALLVAPDHHCVLLQNDKVRVLDTRLRLGEQTTVPAHQWPGTSYVVSWSEGPFADYRAQGKQTSIARP
jgi:hypothetical protein